MKLLKNIFGSLYWYSFFNKKEIIIFIHKHYIFYRGLMTFPKIGDSEGDELYERINTHATPMFSLQKSRLIKNKIKILKISETENDSYICNVWFNTTETPYEAEFCKNYFDELFGYHKKIQLFTNVE